MNFGEMWLTRHGKPLWSTMLHAAAGSEFHRGRRVICGFVGTVLTARRKQDVRRVGYSRRLQLKTCRRNQLGLKAENDGIFNRFSNDSLSTPECMRRFEDSLFEITPSFIVYLLEVLEGGGVRSWTPRTSRFPLSHGGSRR